MRTFGRVVLGTVVAAVVSLPLGGASAQPAGERIRSYDVAIDVSPSGRMHVVETIAYDFGTFSKHGILRTIPVRFQYDREHDRVYPVSGVTVTSPTPGTPTQLRKRRDATLNLRVGDPDRTVTGLHTYVIAYDVAGAVNRFEGHDELYWNAIGTEWAVPIDRATVRVTAPGPVSAVNCFTGARLSTLHCASAKANGRTATFAQSRLFPHAAVTVVAALPPGAVSSPGPVLAERRSLDRAFSRSRAAIAGAVAVEVLCVGVVLWLVSSRGRDRTFTGEVPGLEPPAGVTPVEAPAPVLGDRAGPIEYAPDDDMRPALMGVLVDERADPLDVTATIVDLAVRRYLTIEELPRRGLFHRRDWLLTRIPETPGDGMAPWERTLLKALFPAGDVTYVSSLKRTFHPSLVRVQQALYQDVVGRRWFARSPDETRTGWARVAAWVTVAGLGLTFVLARFTHLGLVGVPVVLAGLMLAALSHRMPARTAKGSAALARALGFKRYLATAEAEQLRFEEREGIFARFLPYAIVLGEAERWARVFGDLGDKQAENLYWYSGPSGWSPMHFTESFGAFSTATAGTLAATPASSGSSGFGGGGSSGGGGFSGGGGGGGGGGSW